ncbi:MAG: SIMPL domain-containing protein [Candidatus Methanomethyliaceae archaeon]|nr:SIMPL domain-containing protein [Candidatus Methanomethyliaceae archaeon]
MKYLAFLGLALTLFMLGSVLYSPQQVQAADLDGGQNLGTLSVVGNAVLYEQPDTVKVIIGTSVLDPDVQKATASAANNINRALSALKGLGIPESSIQTLSYTIGPEYRYINNEQVLIGYRVVHTIQVTYSGPDLGRMAGNIIDACVDSGLNQVNGVYFAVSDAKLSVLRTTALETAVKDARAKADTISKILGVKVVGVQSVSESYSSPVPIYRSYDLAVTSSTTILPGAVSISASISITFYIQ